MLPGGFGPVSVRFEPLQSYFGSLFEIVTERFLRASGLRQGAVRSLLCVPVAFARTEA
jgi:hypothetical protein